MKVRVFVQVSGESQANEGRDYDFDTRPEVGDAIRFSEANQMADFLVSSVSHIQEGGRFVFAVVVQPIDQADEWADQWIAPHESS